MRFLTPDELKKLTPTQAEIYTNRLRRFLIRQVNISGGHLASNLGVAEISVALMRVFSPPIDKIVYDVGHQSYIHKLLTGRGDQFATLRSYGGLCGFTRREESPFDPFGAGHSGTAISAALGILRGEKQSGKANLGKTIAVVGDGAMTGGMIYEALNNLKPTDNIIIVLNDNDMAISKNVGAMSGYMSKMRSSGFYYPLKRKTRSALNAIPLVGHALTDAIQHTKVNIKKMVYPTALDPFGLYYLGPADGNDLRVVERLFKEASACEGPVFVHLRTRKGKGYSPAENDPSLYHSVSSSAKTKKSTPTFSHTFGSTLCALARREKNLCAVTAAMADGCGLNEFSKTYKDRFYDVGIAEEHAATYAAGLAAGGALPVYAVYSTFFQRCYDQVLHDAALQNLPLLLGIDRAGFCDGDGATHHGVFDVPLLSTVPGLILDAPATLCSLSTVLKKAVKELKTDPRVRAVRYPKGCEMPLTAAAFPAYAPAALWGDGHADLLIVTYGNLCEEALKAAKEIKALGKQVAVLLLTRLHPLPDLKKVLSPLCGVDRIFLLEEGIRRGGVMESLLANRTALGLPEAKTSIFAIDDRFVPHGSRSALLRHAGLDANTLVESFFEN